MSSDERRLNELVDRDLPWPTQMEFVAARDRVLDQLRANPRHRTSGTLGTPGTLGTLRTSGSVVRVAAAAALVIVAVGGAIVWPRGARVYAAGNEGLQVTLADDSHVEMRARAEMAVARVSDGIQIDLKTGDIIVTAAKQRREHLSVRTTDMTVAVNGTVFLASDGQHGSRVGVIEGEVRVREGIRETRLRPGEQVASSPTSILRPLTEGISWSRNANLHRAILDSFTKGMAQTSGTLMPVAAPGQPTPGQTGAAGAQAGRLEFEEASIRECDPDNLPQAPAGARGGGPNSLQMTPGRTYALCLTLATLVRIALGYEPMDFEFMNTTDALPVDRLGHMRLDAVYQLDVEDGQRVRGGPDWLRSQHFTIEAVAGNAADAQTMRGPMLRALLERRFQLKAHIETEQVAAYALTVAPGGLKITPMRDGECSQEPLSDAVRAERARHGWTGPVLMTEAQRLGVKPRCGSMYGAVNGPNFRTEHVAQQLGSVALSLGSALDVRVIDRTGITDRFIFGWEFGPDERTPSPLRSVNRERTGTPKPGFDAPATAPKAPSIFMALEQLGLRLEPIHAPRPFIVIDAIERPGPN